MKYIIVEKKNRDLFVIYDTTNGGVCCCSLYTIKQLVNDYHATIIGFNGNKVVECDLDGNVRNKKAPSMCEILTKRSASTIIKGLDEKHYPRTKTVRRCTGSIVEVEFKNETSIGIQLSNGDVCLIDNRIVFKSNIIKINVTTVDKETEKLLKTLITNKEEITKINNKKKKIEDSYDKKIEKLMKERDAILYELNTEIRNNNENSKRLCLDYKYKDVTGNEICNYSFCSKSDVSLEFMKVLIKKTTKPIVYTYGLGYRNPTTYRVPITKEKAFEYLDRCMIDITAETTCIHINEFSGNDMW